VVLVGEPDEKRAFGTPGYRWVYNIKMYVENIGYDTVDWIQMPQNRVQ
jgi:hypothetical protein